MLRAYILACTGIMMACTGSEDENNTPLEAAETYDFSSRFDANSSVFYNNQIFRHTLIDDMKSHSSELTERINSGWFPAPGEVEQEMLFYLDFDSASAGTVSHLTQTNPMASQVVYNDIASGSNLWAKVAGNDSVGQHKEWATEFVGWDEEGIFNLEGGCYAKTLGLSAEDEDFIEQ